MTVDLDAKIPNNVGLGDDPRLQRALETWLPAYQEWWGDHGPTDFNTNDIFLRTAVGVGKDGWAHYDYVKMPDYRWGIFLAPSRFDTIRFGDEVGKPVWDRVPGSLRKRLRELIVTQGDTEPASVEQQRLLGNTAPSLWDLRSLLQVNVEEGRHLWAMVYLLHKFFGADGRDEAETLLVRRSGDDDSPRILETFNEPCETWLDFFMFTTFTDRDGKYQLAALAESAFDPLARTCQFMLQEEAFHLRVGEDGIGRVVRRTAELLRDGEDPAARGGIPLDLIQRYINFWYSSSLDLFGGENSTNAATGFATGMKGRFKEGDREGHEPTALDRCYRLCVPDDDGGMTTTEIDLRRAMNAVLQDEYITDCTRVLRAWNKHLEAAEIDQRLTLPDRTFNRSQGAFTEFFFTPDGERVDEAAWMARRDEWLPTQLDRDYVKSCMKPVREPGKVAAWIAPPDDRALKQVPIGKGQTWETFEYVQFH